MLADDRLRIKSRHTVLLKLLIVNDRHFGGMCGRLCYGKSSKRFGVEVARLEILAGVWVARGFSKTLSHRSGCARRPPDKLKPGRFYSSRVMIIILQLAHYCQPSR